MTPCQGRTGPLSTCHSSHPLLSLLVIVGLLVVIQVRAEVGLLVHVPALLVHGLFVRWCSGPGVLPPKLTVRQRPLRKLAPSSAQRAT